MPSDADRQLWTDVDGVLTDHLLAPDPALDAALAAADEAGLPKINVAPNQGKFLHLLVRALGARRVLEIGTLGAYSTIWIARALPEGGRIVSLEAEPKHVEVSRHNLAAASVDDRAQVIPGPALETLPSLLEQLGTTELFDLAFIDADKEHNADYFEWALKLVRPGGVIIVDNVVRQGAIVDPAHPDPRVAGTLRLFSTMAGHPEADSTAVQTVGSKGHDGFTFTIVPGDS